MAKSTVKVQVLREAFVIALGIEIRRALETDLTEVVVLERETPTAPHWAAQEYRAMVQEGHNGGVRRCLFVAVEAGALHGFAVGKAVGARPDVEAEIESVVVREAVRRQGLGIALCRAVMAWSRKEGARAIELEVRSRSAGAVHLYGGLGFHATGRRAGYYRNPEDDGLMMRCTLQVAAIPEDRQGSLSGWLDV